jgi:NitT/TauT family transport system permease protein
VSDEASTLDTIKEYAAPICAAVALLLAWEAIVRFAAVPAWLLPTPSAIAAAAWRVRYQLPVHIAATVWATVAGFICAVALGAFLAALIAVSDFSRKLLSPILAGLQAIPKNALAPLFIVWFGGGVLSKIAITFLISFFPIVINAASGMTRIDRDIISLTHTIRASKYQTFWHVRVPHAVPAFLSGCKIAITLAIIGAVIGEFVASDRGLGYLILISSSQLQTDVAFVAILSLAICGTLLFWCVSKLEEWIVPKVSAPTGEAA